MSYASVWCNGQYVGGWPYGYASFRLDLTPYIKAGQKNVLAIRLDNPDDTSRWYPGSGIYRNVWLVKRLLFTWSNGELLYETSRLILKLLLWKWE